MTLMSNVQAKAFRSTDEDDDDSEDDYSDDEELQSPIDEVDPFILFVDTVKGKQRWYIPSTLASDNSSNVWCEYLFVADFIFFFFDIEVMQGSDPLRFQNLTQTLEFQYQALANGVAQHADQRRVEIEKEKLEKAAAAPS